MGKSISHKVITLMVVFLVITLPVAYANSLPHSVFDGQKVETNKETSITPAYISQDSYTDKDLKKELELKYTYNLDEFIEMLNRDPVEIFWYIRNNFDYEPYYGSMKGPEGTFLQRSGNDLDLANLLVEIYRQLGIPARYVRGNIILSEEELQKWFGLDDVERVLKAGLIPYEKNGNRYIVEHFWMEAYINGTWIPLDPSFKEYEYIAPEVTSEDISLDFGEMINRTIENTVFENGSAILPMVSSDVYEELSPDVYEPFGENLSKIAERYIGNVSQQSVYRTLKNLENFEYGVFGQWRIVKVVSGEFPSELPYEVNNVLEEFSSIPVELRYQVNIYLPINGLNITLNISEINGKRVVLTYLPYNQSDMKFLRNYESIEEVPIDKVNVTPALLVDGVPIRVGEKTHLGTKDNLTIEVHIGEYSFGRDRTEITIGGDYVIGINALRVSDQFLDYRVNRFKITKFMIDNGFRNVTREEVAGELLNLIALTYWYRLDRYASRLSRSLEIKWIRMPSILVTGSAWRIENNTIKMIGMFMDIHKDYYIPIQKDGDKNKERAFMIETGLRGAKLEYEVFEDILGITAVSTAKIFEISQELGIPIVIVNSTNANTTIPSLEVSDFVKEKVREAVEKGYVVLIPQRNIVINDWEGTGYYIIDPETGAMAYMLSEGIRGGWSWSSVWEWAKTAADMLLTVAIESLKVKWKGIGEVVDKIVDTIKKIITVGWSDYEGMNTCEVWVKVINVLMDIIADFGFAAMSTVEMAEIVAMYSGPQGWLVAIALKAAEIAVMALCSNLVTGLLRKIFGLDDPRSKCAGPELVVHERSSLEEIKYGEKRYNFYAFRIGNKGPWNTELKWEIPEDFNWRKAESRAGIWYISPSKGTIWGSSSKYRINFDEVYLSINTKWISKKYLTKIMKNQGIVEYKIPIKTNDIHAPLYVVTVRYRLVEDLAISLDHTLITLRYPEGSEDTDYIYIKTYMTNASLKITPEKVSRVGLTVSYPKHLEVGEWHKIEITSSNAPKGNHEVMLTLVVTYKKTTKRINVPIFIDVYGKEEREDGGESPDTSVPGNDHPDDNFDVPRISLTKEISFYSLLREGIKKNISEAKELYTLANYLSMLSNATSINVGDYRELAMETSKLYKMLSANLEFLKDLNEKAPSVAVFKKGFYVGTENLLNSAKIAFREVEPEEFDPLQLVKHQKILILSSGSLFGMNTQSFKEKLRLYLENGGNIIVFDQQYGEDYSVIPGGLNGYGWAQDQMCHSFSLYAAQDHPILSTLTRNEISEEVDGYFDTYPPNSIVLMRRTKNHFPAMLLYEYGKGHVLATTLYSDWKSQDSISWFMVNILRDAIAYLELKGNIYEIGTKKAWFGFYYTNATYLIPIKVNNPTNVDAEQIKLRLIRPDGKITTEIIINKSIKAGEESVIHANISKENLKPLQFGIWTVDYSLIDHNGREIYSKYDAKGISVNYYTDNDYIFNYQGGEKYLVWITSSKENTLFGEPINMTLHIINNDDQALSGQVGIGHHIGGWRVLEVKNVTINPGEYKKITFTVYPYADVRSWGGHEPGLTYYIGFYRDKSPYEGHGNFNDAFLRAEKGVYVRYPDVSLRGSVDKTSYAPGETLQALANITNENEIDWKLYLKVNIFRWKWVGDERVKELIVSEGKLIQLPAFSNTLENLELKLPDSLELGYYTVEFLLMDEYKNVTAALSYSGFSKTKPEVLFMQRFDYNPLTFILQTEVTNNISLNFPVLRIHESIREFNQEITYKDYEFNLTFVDFKNITTIPIQDDIFGVYSFAYQLYDGNEYIDSGYATFERKIILEPEIEFNGRELSNLTLRINMTNPTQLEEEFVLNVTIPDINYTYTTPLTLNANGSRLLNFTIFIPEIGEGSHEIIIRAQKERGYIEKKAYFHIRSSWLSVSFESRDYSAGENATAYIENEGGVSTTANGTLYIEKDGQILSKNEFSILIKPGEKKEVKVPIPLNITRGALLVINVTDLKEGRTISRWTWLSLKEAMLEATYETEVYAMDNMTITLTNVGGLRDTLNVTITLRRSWWDVVKTQEYHNLTFGIGESKNVTFEIPNVQSGEYELIISSIGEESRRSSFHGSLKIIGMNLTFETDKDIYNAGENITLTITNHGGGYRQLRLEAWLRDSMNFNLESEQIAIGKLESKQVEFNIPIRTPTGEYIFVVYYDGKSYSKRITVKGLELNVSLVRDFYDVDESVELLVNNTGSIDADLIINYTIGGIKDNISTFVAAGSSRVVHLDIPKSLRSLTYQLSLEIQERNTGKMFYEQFYIRVRGAELEITPKETSLTTGENLPITFRNVGGINLNLSVELKVEDYTTITAFNLMKGEEKNVTFSLPALSKGEYTVWVIANDSVTGRQFSTSFMISVSGFVIRASLNKDTFSIGEIVNITLYNENPNLDAQCDYTLYLRDKDGNRFDVGSGDVVIPRDSQAYVAFQIEGLAKGNYSLTIRLREKNTNEVFLITKRLHIEGLWGEIEVDMPNEVFAGDEIKVLVNLTGNTNGTLRVSRGAKLLVYPSGIGNIEVDESGIWIFFRHYLGLYDGEGLELFKYPVSIGPAYESAYIPAVNLEKEIWIGSGKWILRFDKSAEEWNVYSTESIDGFPAYIENWWGREEVQIMDIAYYNNSLWVGTNGVGLIRVNTSTMRVIAIYNSSNSIMPFDYVMQLKVNGSALWVVSLGIIKISNEWQYIDPSEFNLDYIDAIEIVNDELWAGGGNDQGVAACKLGGECITNLPAWRISRLEHDNESLWIIYVSWENIGSSRYYFENGTREDYGINTFWGSLIDVEDSIYASSKFGIILNGEQKTFGPIGSVVDIAYHDEKAYLLTESGINIYDFEKDEWSYLTQEELMYGGNIHYASNRLWITRWDSLVSYNINTGEIVVYDSSNSPFSSSRNPTSITGNDTVLFIGTNDGLVIFDLTNNIFNIVHSPLPSNGIRDVYLFEDELWIASDDGAGIYDIESNVYEPYLTGEMTRKVIANGKEVWVVYENNNLWRYLRDSDTFEIYNSTNGLREGYIEDIAKFNNMLFVAYSDAQNISVFDGSGWSILDIPAYTIESTESMIFFGGSEFIVYSGDVYEFPLTLGVNEIILSPIEKPGEFDYEFVLQTQKMQLLDMKKHHIRAYERDIYADLYTPKLLYKKGEEAIFEVILRNNAPLRDNVTYELILGNETFEGSVLLEPAQEMKRTFTVRSEGDFNATLRVGEREIVKKVTVVEPKGEVRVDAPDIVGYLEPFNVSLSIINTGEVSLEVNVNFDGSEFNLTIPVNKSVTLTKEFRIREDKNVSIEISGDIRKNVKELIRMGESVKVIFEDKYLLAPGYNELPFEVRNEGSLDSTFNLSVSSETFKYVKELTIPKGENTTLYLPVYLEAGTYEVNYTTKFENGSFVIEVVEEKLEVNASLEREYNITISNLAPLDFVGTLEIVSSILSNTTNVTISSGSSIHLSFNVGDLEAGTYNVTVKITRNGRMILEKTFTYSLSPIYSIEIEGTKNEYKLDENATFTVKVKNVGNAIGEDLLTFEIPGIYKKESSLTLKPNEEIEREFNVTMPKDLPSREFKAVVSIGNMTSEMSFKLIGVNLTVTPSLNKDYYYEDENVTFTLTIRNNENITLNGNISVVCGIFNSTEPFEIGYEVKTFNFTFPACDRVFYSVRLDSGRLIHIDSRKIPVHERGLEVLLYTDKSRYHIGENMTIYISSNKPTTLAIVVFGNVTFVNVTQNTSLTLQVPDVPSGTYEIVYSTEEETYTYEFDVISPSAKILDFELKAETLNPEQNISFRVNVYSDEEVLGKIKVWLYNERNLLIDYYDQVITLSAGENVLDVNTTMSVPSIGNYYLLYAIYRGLNSTLLASGVQTLQTEGATIVSLASDKSEYYENENINLTVVVSGDKGEYTIVIEGLEEVLRENITIDGTRTLNYILPASKFEKTITVKLIYKEYTESESLDIMVINLPPKASFDIKGEPKVNSTLIFDASLSSDPGDDALTYVWDFGDGHEITTENPIVEHVYTKAGNYTVTLRVVDEQGEFDIYSEQIEILSVAEETPMEEKEENALATLLLLAKTWTLRFLKFHREYEDLIARAKELEIDNETLSNITTIHENATDLIVSAWRVNSLEDVKKVIRYQGEQRYVPRAWDIRKAYLMEKRIVEILRELLKE